ncbi:MAG: BapA prefix-like domain-containing protein [Gammaproteobacteria bacterium]|nr:BapA prefix-like domain-containing protein [Gammaproteobacteria bacterium]
MLGKSIGVVKKVNGEVSSLDWANTVTLDGVSAVQMPFGPMDVQAYKTDGVDLLISLNSGDVVTIENFFTEFGEDEEISELVLKDEQGVLWRGQFDPMTAEFNFTEIAALDAGADIASGALLNMPDWAMLGLAVLAVGGGAVAVHGSGSSSSSSNKLTPSESDVPEAPSDIKLSDDVVTGKAEAGLTVQVTDAQGKLLGKEVVVGEDGNFEYDLLLTEGPQNGESIFVIVKNGAGVSSAPIELGNQEHSNNEDLAAGVDPDSNSLTVNENIEISLIDADENDAKTAVVGEKNGFDFSAMEQSTEFDLFDDESAVLELSLEGVLDFSDDNEQLSFFAEDENAVSVQASSVNTSHSDALDVAPVVDPLDDAFEQHHLVI